MKKKKVKSETDYRALYIMGISFLPLGIILSVVINIGFLGIVALGAIYMAMGLKNRDKWKK